MIKVLVVDDNKDNRMTIKLLLEDFEEILLIEAEDGKKAVEITAPIMPDLIFMDIMMPVMDGLTATKAIRALNRPDAGMNAHLAKPLDIEKVKKTICEHTIELYNKE